MTVYFQYSIHCALLALFQPVLLQFLISCTTLWVIRKVIYENGEECGPWVGHWSTPVLTVLTVDPSMFICVSWFLFIQLFSMNLSFPVSLLPAPGVAFLLVLLLLSLQQFNVLSPPRPLGVVMLPSTLSGCIWWFPRSYANAQIPPPSSSQRSPVLRELLYLPTIYVFFSCL